MTTAPADIIVSTINAASRFGKRGARDAAMRAPLNAIMARMTHDARMASGVSKIAGADALGARRNRHSTAELSEFLDVLAGVVAHPDADADTARLAQQLHNDGLDYLRAVIPSHLSMKG